MDAASHEMIDTMPAYRGAFVRDSDDPFQPVSKLGDRASRWGLLVGLLVALGTHGGASAKALTSLGDMRLTVEFMNERLHEYFWANYEVDVVDDKPNVPEKEEKEEETVPEPEPEPEPVAEQEPTPDDPYEDEPPPAPAKASKILTRNPDPNEIVDYSDDGFVSGEAEELYSGYASAAGTAERSVRSPAAKVGGKVGGKGQGPVRKPKPQRNLSRPAGLQGGSSWSNCPFPAEADIEQVDRAVVRLVVYVRPNGSPGRVSVLSDPGFGFGRQARACALARRYQPAHDASGQAIAATTPPIDVLFRR